MLKAMSVLYSNTIIPPSGSVAIGGSFKNNQKDVAFWKGSATADGPTTGSANIPATNWTASSFSATSILNAFSGNSLFTATIPGEYAISFVVSMSTTAAPNNLAFIQLSHSTLGIVAGNSFFSNASGANGPVTASTTVRMAVGETIQPLFYLSTGYHIQLVSLTISAVKEYTN
jgi:hypothetical protein